MKATITSAVLAAVVWLVGDMASAQPIPRPNTVAPGKIYHCMYTNYAPLIDGNITDPVWDNALWTSEFVDIQGEYMPTPTFRTRAKMLWDAEFFYFAFELEEPHLQASFTKRDSYIYQLDNDIEVFIDPDGDSHNYMELEMNALNTVWDLLLTRPYRDDGKALHGWDFKGLQTAVALNGTLNDPSDVDVGWSVEIAIPWTAMGEAAGTACPPVSGDYWGVNFSRVQWKFVDEDGRYVKQLDPKTGEHYPEDNWVWSPPGLISMHYPERWGYVKFLTEQPGSFEDADIFLWDSAIHILYNLYYSQRDYYGDYGEYSEFLAEVLSSEFESEPADQPILAGFGQTYTASIELPTGGFLWIDQTGRNWFEAPEHEAEEAE